MANKEYHKIENIFERDMEGTKRWLINFFEYVWFFCSAFLSVLLVYYLASAVFDSNTDCLQYSVITGKKTLYTDGKCYEYVNGKFKVVDFEEMLK